MMTLLRKTSALALAMGAAGFMIPSAALTSGPGDDPAPIAQWDEPRLPETVTTAPVWTDLNSSTPVTAEAPATVEDFPITYGTTTTTPATSYEYGPPAPESLATPSYEYGDVAVSQATTSGYDYGDDVGAVSGYGSIPLPLHRDHGGLHKYTSPFYGAGCGTVPSCGGPVYQPPVYQAPVYQPPPPPKVVYRDRPIYRDRPVWRDRVVEKRVFVDRPIYVNRKVVVDRPIYVNRPIPVDRPVYVEKRVPVPVHIRQTVPVDRPIYVEKRVPVPVPRPYAVPVDRPVYVEKRVPVPVHIQHRVPVDRPVYVERRVPVPVPRPYPVDRPVYVDRPVAPLPVVTATTNGCADPCSGFGHGNHGWGAGAVYGGSYGHGHGFGGGYGYGYGIEGASFRTPYEGFGVPLAYPAFDPHVQQLSSQISAASVRIAEGERERTISDREAASLRKDLQKVMNELDEARKDGKVDRKEIAEIAHRLHRLTAELNEKRLNLETADLPFGPYGPAAQLGYPAYGAPVPAHVGFPGPAFGGYPGFYGAPARPSFGSF